MSFRTINEERARCGLPPITGGERICASTIPGGWRGVYSREVPLGTPSYRPSLPPRKTMEQRVVECGAVVDLDPRTGRPLKIVVSRVWRTGRDVKRVIEWPHPVCR